MTSPVLLAKQNHKRTTVGTRHDSTNWVKRIISYVSDHTREGAADIKAENVCGERPDWRNCCKKVLYKGTVLIDGGKYV